MTTETVMHLVAAAHDNMQSLLTAVENADLAIRAQAMPLIRNASDAADELQYAPSPEKARECVDASEDCFYFLLTITK